MKNNNTCIFKNVSSPDVVNCLMNMLIKDNIISDEFNTLFFWKSEKQDSGFTISQKKNNTITKKKTWKFNLQTEQFTGVPYLNCELQNITPNSIEKNTKSYEYLVKLKNILEI